MWPQTRNLKKSLRDGKFEPSEGVKAHLEKQKLGLTDTVTYTLWEQAEKRIFKEEETPQDATGDEEENKSLFWWFFRDTSPQL